MNAINANPLTTPTAFFLSRKIIPVNIEIDKKLNERKYSDSIVSERFIKLRLILNNVSPRAIPRKKKK